MISNYSVSGITCDHCVHAIKSEIAGLPGVTGVELDQTGVLAIESENPIDFDRIVEAVAEAGDNYSVA